MEPPATTVAPDSEQTLVLVVDDSITMRRVTQRLLERNGMRVVTAKDGVEAVAALQNQIPDVILLDIEMPRMDGYEFATHVRNNAETKDLPIIMITSRVSDKHKARAIELGVNDYLGKPYQEQELLAAHDRSDQPVVVAEEAGEHDDDGQRNRDHHWPADDRDEPLRDEVPRPRRRAQEVAEGRGSDDDLPDHAVRASGGGAVADDDSQGAGERHKERQANQLAPAARPQRVQHDEHHGKGGRLLGQIGGRTG